MGEIPGRQLVLEGLGRGRHHRPRPEDQGGHQVGQALAGARPGLHDQVSLLADGLGHRLGHRHLGGAILLLGQSRRGAGEGGTDRGVGHDLQATGRGRRPKGQCPECQCPSASVPGSGVPGRQGVACRRGPGRPRPESHSAPRGVRDGRERSLGHQTGAAPDRGPPGRRGRPLRRRLRRARPGDRLLHGVRLLDGKLAPSARGSPVPPQRHRRQPAHPPARRAAPDGGENPFHRAAGLAGAPVDRQAHGRGDRPHPPQPGHDPDRGLQLRRPGRDRRRREGHRGLGGVAEQDRRANHSPAPLRPRRARP